MNPKLSETELKIVAQVANENKTQTIEHLIAALKEKMPNVPEEELSEVVRKLQADGEINLDAPAKDVSAGIAFYAKSRQAVWYWVTVVTSIISAMVVFVLPEQFYPWAGIRQILGALLVLWFPGYSLTKGLIPTLGFLKSWSETEKAILQMCLSLCMSLAISSLLTLLLNYMPWGIRSDSVTLSLLGFTIFVSTVSFVREPRTQNKFQ